MRNVLHAKWWIAVLAVAAVVLPAHAETFPNRTIRIIVPYAAGGSIDLTGRVVAKHLQDLVGQSVIVENKPGANAAIGIDDLLRSAPDGHTLVVLSDSPVTVNVHLSKVNYDPLTGLVPIGRLVSSPLILTANARAGIKSIPDLIAAAKAKPLSYGTAAIGSSSYLAGVLFQRALGITLQPVPYRGGAPAAVAIASGVVPLGFTDTGSVLPMVRNGQLIALGVADPVRARSMPNIPTLLEAGVPDFTAASWLAMFAPRGTPDDRVAKLNSAIAKVLAMPDVEKVLSAAGLEPDPNTPAQMRGIIDADYKKWGQVIKTLNLKVR